MGENLKIDSYEPYIIGLKIKPDIRLDLIEKKLKEVLHNKDFEVPSPMTDTQGPISVRIGPPVNVLGLKHGAELKINFDTYALNIESDNPENAKKVFDEMSGIFKDIKFDLKDTIIFYEIIGNIIVETEEKSPREVINKSCKINLENLSDLDTNVTGIKINSVNEGQRLIGLIIEPRAGNPNKFYFVNLIYRSSDPEDLITFHNQIPTKIKEVLTSLEEQL